MYFQTKTYSCGQVVLSSLHCCNYSPFVGDSSLTFSAGYIVMPVGD